MLVAAGVDESAAVFRTQKCHLGTEDETDQLVELPGEAGARENDIVQVHAYRARVLGVRRIAFVCALEARDVIRMLGETQCLLGREHEVLPELPGGDIADREATDRCPVRLGQLQPTPQNDVATRVRGIELLREGKEVGDVLRREAKTEQARDRGRTLPRQRG